MNANINWSEKVKNLDETIRKEIGIEDDNEAKHILIKVQTKSAESIEPAFIVVKMKCSWIYLSFHHKNRELLPLQF